MINLAKGGEKMRPTKNQCLHAGLQASSEKSAEFAGSLPWMLASLEYLASNLIEGDKLDKKFARDNLKKLIGRGRCILNASDFNAGLKKGQGSICGNPANGEPCTNPNEAECSVCLALPPSKEITP